MLQCKSFKADDDKGMNEFLATHSIKGDIKYHPAGQILIYYEVYEKDNKLNHIQYLQGMLEVHWKKQWEYEDQMRMNIKLRDLFDKKTQAQAWNDANNSVITSARMLEMEIMTTSVTLDILKSLGVHIEQPHIEIPIPEEPETIETLAKKINKDADKKGKA